MGSSSSHSRDSLSMHCSTERKESPMHEEATPTGSQAEPMEVGDDAPYLHLEGDRELQV